MPKTYPELTSDFVRRMVTYTDEVTYFGENSAGMAIAKADAGLGTEAASEIRSLLRRFTLLGARDDDLDEVLQEHGTRRRRQQHARVLIVLRPWVAVVTAITAGKIEVGDSSKFEVGDSLRLRNEDGTVTEKVTVAAITTATGPNGNDELDVGSVVGTYTPSTEDVAVLLRKTIAEGTLFGSEAGIAFASIEDVTVGDLNPVLDGESEVLSLNDKVWAEAQTSGEAGKIPADTITGFSTAEADVKDARNPERGYGGEDQELDFSAKRRAARTAQLEAQETQSFMEAMAQKGNNKVLRVFEETATTVSTVQLAVLTRSGGGLSTDEKDALTVFMEQRLRSHLNIKLVNVTLTAVEVTAEVTLDPGTTTAQARLRKAWRKSADTIATFLDYRKWEGGEDVDEADLLSIINGTDGIATVVTSTFVPTADISVAATSLPVFTRLTLTDTVSGQSIGANLTPEF